MAKTQFLPFEIHLRDEARVAQLQGNPPGETSAQGAQVAIIRAPLGAAAEFAGDNGGVTLPLISMADPIPTTGAYIYSNWFQAGNPEWGVNFPVDVATFVKKSGGWFGIPFLFPSSTRFYWRGTFHYDAPATTQAPGGGGTRSAIMRRRWLDPYFGNTANVVGNTGEPSGTAFAATRDAGRHVESIGLGMRGKDGVRRHLTIERIGGAQLKDSWERLYVRIRKYGDGIVWQARSNEGGGQGGCALTMPLSAADGLEMHNISATSTFTRVGETSPLELNKWYLVDIIIKFATAAGPGTFRVFLNHVEQVNLSIGPGGSGLGANETHVNSNVGNPNGFPYTGEFDIGYWHNADVPTTLNGIDWLNGSRAVLIRPTGFAVGHSVDWAGDWAVLQNTPVPAIPDTASGQVLTSAVANAALRVTTDVARARSIPGALGIASMMISHYGLRGGLGNVGTLGYNINADPDVTVPMDGVTVPHTEAEGQAGMAWSHKLYHPIGAITPAAIDTLELIRTKGNSVEAAATAHLTAVAEVIGVFGNEDYGPDLDPALKYLIPEIGKHNAPYPETPWARSVSPPFSPVVIKSGTYVGNGTHTDLTFRAPVHWIWIRRTTNPGLGAPLCARWWTTMLGPSIGGQTSPGGFSITNALINPDFPPPAIEGEQSQQTIVRIASDHLEVNRLGETYVYTAVCDPGQRFMLNGALSKDDTLLPATEALINPDFTGIWAFILDERGGSNITTVEMAVRGPGHAAGASSKLDPFGTAVASGVQMEAGAITINAGQSAAVNIQMPYSLWRREDGSTDPGRHNVVRLTSYVGNGAADRNIPLTPVTGMRPLWALVAPHGAKAYTKDSQHAGGNSRAVDNSNDVITAIKTGAPDAINVGLTLNANGVLYNVFAIMGGTAAGPDGFSVAGEFVPVEPESPVQGPWGPDPLEPSAGGVGGGGGGQPPGTPGGGVDDMDKDCTVACQPFTTRVANIALQRIGVSRHMVNVCTDASEDGSVARTHYARALKETLRDFPWPFATRYAALSLVGGTSISAYVRDWQYAYRVPTDCIFERRIAVLREGSVDPTPPPMARSFDTVGGLILTNQASAILEYTARPECTATQGDPLFVDALCWKLAAMMAIPLSKLQDREKYCLDKYDEQIRKAHDVIRPGNPGPRATVDASGPDVGSGCEASNVGVVNRALVRIGARTIANLQVEQSREAESARLIFEDELRTVLRDFAWPFCTKYDDSLVHVYGPVSAGAHVLAWSSTTVYVKGDVVTRVGVTYWARLASTAQQPPNATYWTTVEPASANDDWTFAYRVPTDCVDVRRIVREGMKQRFDPAPAPFRIGQDARGLILFTDEDAPTIEYTARINCVVKMGDALFRDALAWRLAACLAPSLAQVDPAMPEQLGRGVETKPRERKATEAQLRERATRYAWAMYEHAIKSARANAMNEAEPQDTDAGGDPDWLRGRN